MTIKSTLILRDGDCDRADELRPAPGRGGAARRRGDREAECRRRRIRRRAQAPARSIAARPLAAFGAIAGTIAVSRQPMRGAITMSRITTRRVTTRRRSPAITRRRLPVFGARYRHRDYYSRWGGSGGQPGYHGPNVNVPGPTNYGNAGGPKRAGAAARWRTRRRRQLVKSPESETAALRAAVRCLGRKPDIAAKIHLLTTNRPSCAMLCPWLIGRTAL